LAKELQFIDSTGYINLRNKEFRENNGNSTTNPGAVTHPSGNLVNMPVHPHPGSAHGMMGQPPMNSLSTMNLQPLGAGNPSLHPDGHTGQV